MKSKVPLIIAGILLFIFISVTSMLWYHAFYQPKKEVSVLQIGKDHEENATIDLSNMIPMSDEEGAQITPYEFQVQNSGDKEKEEIYRVLIEDEKLSDDPNFSSKSLLSRSQLKYQLTMNGTVIKKGKLSDIKNNILDERSIAKGKENNYQLRIYLGTNVANTAWQNKYYHYIITIQKMEDIK